MQLSQDSVGCIPRVPLQEQGGSGMAGAEWEGGFLKEGLRGWGGVQPQGTRRLENKLGEEL